jgi:pimeloyl-ACP methyl ester carboxylesterase
MSAFTERKMPTRISKSLWGYLLLASLTLPVVGCAQQPATIDVKPASPSGANTPNQASAPKTIVFVHGMFMTPKTWDNWQAYFKGLGYTTVAPAWPLHDAPLEQQRSEAAKAALGKLTLDQVIDSYRQMVRGLPEKPIVIGHSMGGLVAQKLLSEGLAAKAVAIDSAPASGLIVAKWSFIRSNWAVASPFANVDEPYSPSLDEFRYAFANCLSDTESAAIYRDYIVPESRRVGRGTAEKAAEIDFSKPHGPLLMVAGEDDHIIPADLNRKNFEKYNDSSSARKFYQFPGKCHALVVDKGWKEVADYVGDWLKSQ